MGEKFLADRDKWFKNRQDAQWEKHFGAADLITATSDRHATIYRFKSNISDLKIGSHLQLIDDNHDGVSVFCGMRRVGYVDAAGSSDLRHLFARFPAFGNAVGAYLCEEQDWCAYYSAKLNYPNH